MPISQKMSPTLRVSLGLALAVTLCIAASLSAAQETQVQAVSYIQPLVRGPVNDSIRTTLSGNVHPMARPKYDRGPVEDSFAVNRLYLLLKRSPAQESALAQFLEDAHTQGSPSYHKWLTPEQFGKRFGAADSDIAAATAWLESHGFTVNHVHPGRIAIEFSGNAAQVREAFNTEIHRYAIQGQTYYANARDPQIPSALSHLVAGISPMHSFHAQPLIKVAGKTSYNPKTHVAKPTWTYPDGGSYITFELAPSDFAVQYDLNPVYTAGTKGAGQSIGILSVSNVDLSLVAAYQKLFSLPNNVPTVVIDGADPGENGAAIEAYLDVELSGSVAPEAKVYLYASDGSILTDPLLTSGLRALQDNLVNVISMSYGSCEASLGASGNTEWNLLWQEAAAQGITGFVSSGDGGSAGCDNFDTEALAMSGLGVNGLGSTPYNVSVGGTDFYYSNYAVGGSTLTNQVKTYWSFSSSTTPVTSLLQPAPEQVWNNSIGLNWSNGGVYDPNNSSIVAGSGGVSSAAIYPVSGPATGYPKPIWQKGTGVPADKVRDVPDVSLYAANGPNYIFYPICASQGDCLNLGAGGAVYITSVGGTSASSPAMAGIQSLIDQATASRQGQADFVYYALFNKTLAAKPFRDVTVGTGAVPCVQSSPNCVLAASGPAKGYYIESGYPATAGYDRASGIGTVDVANLIKNWSAAVFRPSTTTLTITPSTFAHGTTVSAKATVAPTTGTGTPVGAVGLNSNDPQAYANALDVFTLSGGTVTGSVNNLPGGTYQVVANYSGDSVFGASKSAPVTVTVTKESDTLNVYGWVLNPMDFYLYPLQPGLSIPYGSQVYLDAEPTGVNEAGTPQKFSTAATGAITFTDTVGTSIKSAVAPINSLGIAEFAPSTLVIGNHTMAAKYPGDASYAASTNASAATLTVFKGNTQLYVYPYETSVAAGSNVTVSVQMNPAYTPIVGALPTGNVTVNLGGQSQVVALKAWGIQRDSYQVGVATFTKVPAGILPLTATYAGDANWYGTSATYGSINSLATKPAPTVTLTATTTSYTPTQTVSMTGKVTGLSGKPLPSGYLYFQWRDQAGYYYYYYYYTLQQTATYSYFNLTFPANELGDGVNEFVATFKGDSTYSAQSSLPLAITLNGSDFSITTPTQEVPIAKGLAGAGSVTIMPLRAFTGTVAVTCTAPTGITCTPASAAPTVGAGVSDVINLKVASTVAVGTYPAVITATAGGHTHTAQILVGVH